MSSTPPVPALSLPREGFPAVHSMPSIPEKRSMDSAVSTPNALPTTPAEPTWKSATKSTWAWLKLHKLDFMSGVTVALAQIPEAVAFSFVAGVDPVIGLQASWIMGVITSLAGGRPGQISGATGAIAVVIPPLVEKGIGYLFYGVILAGIFQIIGGLCGAGKLLRMISAPVMIGFVDGLAIVIFLAQLDSFKWTQGNSVGPSSRMLNAFAVLTDGEPWLPIDEILVMLVLVVVTMIVTFVLPKFTRFPSALAGIVVATALEWAVFQQIGWGTRLVKEISSVKGYLPIPIWFDDRWDSEGGLPPFDLDTFTFILPTAIVIAIIGLIESLLTLNLIDEITQTKGSPNRECMGQGLANVVAGAFGGMGGCAMLGQSMINIKSGGVTRVSSFVAGIFTLVILLFVYPAINIIPIAALIGVMFCVVIHTFEWSSLKMIASALLPKQARQYGFVERYILKGAHKIPRGDVLVIVVVTVVTLFTNLAVAVGVGVCLQSLLFSWQCQRSLSVVVREDLCGRDTKVYELHGPLCFASAVDFVDAFDTHGDPDTIEIHCQHGDVHGFSAMEALNTLGQRYSLQNKRVVVKSIKPNDHAILRKAEGTMHDAVVIEECYEPGQLHRSMLVVEQWGEQVANGAVPHRHTAGEVSRANSRDAIEQAPDVEMGGLNVVDPPRAGDMESSTTQTESSPSSLAGNKAKRQ